MRRRTILRYSLYAGAGAALIPGFQACRPDDSTPASVNSFFDRQQLDFIASICDGLLPETDTPGAVALGVPEFYDHMVGIVFNPDDRDAIRTDIYNLQTFINGAADGGSFSALSTEAKSQLLAQLEENWQTDDDAEGVKAAYYSLRNQTIQYYLNTEYVGTNLLNYLPVPGTYEPCISLDETNGKAWTI